jgi:hypothetical protein
VLSTGAEGPSRDLLQRSAAAGVPVCSLYDTADAVIATSGLGVSSGGDLQRLSAELSVLRDSPVRYARASLAGVVWASTNG